MGRAVQHYSRKGVNYNIRSNAGRSLVAHHNELKLCPLPIDQGHPVHPALETPRIAITEVLQVEQQQHNEAQDIQVRDTPISAHLRQAVNLWRFPLPHPYFFLFTIIHFYQLLSSHSNSYHYFICKTILILLNQKFYMNSFISSQFNYCPLEWMFNEKASDAKLNRTFEKALRLVCKGSESTIDRLKEKYMTIHQHNLQLLMVEIFKTKIIYIQHLRETYLLREMSNNLRSKNHLQLPNVKAAKHGIENIQYIGHHLWASLPEEIKDSGTLTNFKQ